MDPLSALGVAASVAQFVSFGCSLVAKTREIYKSTSGISIQYAELEDATRRLMELNAQLSASQRIPRGCGGMESQALEDIHVDCVAIATELLSQLDKLKIRNDYKYRRWKSFRQALKCACSKGEIDGLAERLGMHQKQLDSHILMSLSEKFNDLTVLHDEKFAALDTTLQQNVKALLETLVSMHKRIEQAFQIQQAILHRTQQQLKLDRKFADAKVVKEAAEKSRRLDDHTNERLLRSLRFASIRHRHEEITEAHQKTLSWIFKNPQEGIRPWSDYTRWLSEDTGLYWVNGKAGPGKSTLLRYIYDSPKTIEALKVWAGHAELEVAGFFAWNSGSIEQRSQSGLFRSLLFEVLKNRRDLIRFVFEAPWAEYRYLIQEANESDRDRTEKFEWKWSLATVQHALTRLANLATSRFKLCLFIDGLDECDGDQEDIATYFTDISTLPNIKVCVSSRPWLVFEEAFVHCSSLRLQDLTCHDIRMYVRDKLEANPKMQQLSQRDPDAAAKFIKTTESKANGVFLWVKLVIKSLLAGLRNQDSIGDLQKRLESTPSDLDAVYCLMLNRIDPVYMEQASKIFQIFDRASDLDLRMSVLELDLAVTARFQDGIKPVNEAMSTDEITSRCQQMTTHLKSRCEGLLEVHDLMDRHWDFLYDDIDQESDTVRIENDEDTRDRNTERLRIRVDYKVSYLHRTVKDFLKTSFVREKFRHQTETMANFDPNLSLLVSYLVNLKRSICSFYYDVAGISWDARLWNIMRDTLVIAKSISESSTNLRNILLHEMYSLGQKWWQHKSLSLDSKLLNPEPYRQTAEWCQDFISMAVCLDLDSFVDEKLKLEKSLPSGTDGIPLLAYALKMIHPRTLANITSEEEHGSPRMVGTVLRRGADPNEALSHLTHYKKKINKSDIYTVWQELLRRMHASKQDSRPDLEVLKEYARVFKAMLKHGADPFALCPCPVKVRANMGLDEDNGAKGDLITDGGPAAPKDLLERLKDRDSKEASLEVHVVPHVIIDLFAERLPDETRHLYKLIQDRSVEMKGTESKSSHSSGMANKGRKRTFQDVEESDNRVVVSLLVDDDEESFSMAGEGLCKLNAIKRMKMEPS